MRVVDVAARELRVDEREIWRAMGAVDCAPDQITLALIDQMSDLLLNSARPQFCYTIAESLDFSYGKIIRDALKDGDRFAILVCTVGREVDDLLRELRDTDIVKAFVADTIASELVEALSRRAVEIIESTVAAGEGVSNPYSPGYCGWLLKEQRKLFSYFEEAPCGVTLNDSCLMLPIKSTSSVVAIGKRVVKAPYGCEICTKEDCFKKRK